MIHRVTIARHELGLYYRDDLFERILDPGTHWLIEPLRKVEVRRVSLMDPEVTTPDAEMLALEPDVARRSTLYRIQDTQRGLVYKDGKFHRFLAPGAHLFLKTPASLRVEVVDIRNLVVDHADAPVLAGNLQAAPFISTVAVPDGHRAVLFVDQAIDRVLEPGRHHYWNGYRVLHATLVDMRERLHEISGQELMTQDKVSIRINLSTRYRVTDARLAVSSQAGYEATLYRELQLALREEVGGRTLDDILARKEDLGERIAARVRPGLEAMGLALHSSGLKDIILPGDMRQILNQVIEAEKRAQANMITRREETAATRSLLNTAKLLETNPLLLRLKELESVERIAEKIGSLSVVGGLDGLMRTLGEAARLGPEKPAD